MKKLLTILLFSCSLALFGHKDRVSRPTSFVFTFSNKEIIKLTNVDKDKIKKYSDDIVNNNVDLVSAEVTFEDGEKAVFKRLANKWVSILLVDGKKEVTVPDATLNKIPEIHFETIDLLWDGTYKNAFSAEYFYLRLDIGKEKSFNQYPELELFFSGKKYTKANLVRQIDENTTQDSDF
jgi:hypothetical protein